MKQDIENIKEQLEEVIKKNLPEKMEWQGGEAELHIQIADGFNQALSQINTSLIADEVLKVVRMEIEKWISKNEYCARCCSPKKFCLKWSKDLSAIETGDLLSYLLTLSPNKENKK